MDTRTITITNDGVINTVVSHSEKETYEIAKDIASQLKGGETLSLTGDLGAGKTLFTKGLADTLDISHTITSPTFVVMKVYQVTAEHNDISTLCHVDAYRLTSGHDLEDIGIKDYLDDKHAVTVIEWAKRVTDIIPNNAIWIHFEHGDTLTVPR